MVIVWLKGYKGDVKAVTSTGATALSASEPWAKGPPRGEPRMELDVHVFGIM